MKNKNLLLLSLFLVFPAATQCMEHMIVTNPKTMQDIRNYRDDIYKKRLNRTNTPSLDFALFQEDWDKYLTSSKQNPTEESIPLLCYFREISKQSPFLGLTAIAIKSERIADEDYKVQENHKKELLNKKNPEQVPFKKKKNTLKNFLH